MISYFLRQRKYSESENNGHFLKGDYGAHIIRRSSEFSFSPWQKRIFFLSTLNLLYFWMTYSEQFPNFPRYFRAVFILRNAHLDSKSYHFNASSYIMCKKYNIINSITFFLISWNLMYELNKLKCEKYLNNFMNKILCFM